MVSFKDFRELLILLHANHLISHAEFVLLYDTFSSKNPDLPYNSYEQFNLDAMNAAECEAEFRVEKQDLPRLSQTLQLPPVFRCEHRCICDSMEGLCILLKRVAYHCRLSDLVPRFARPVSVLSLITNQVLDYIYAVHAHRITLWNQDILNPVALQSYAMPSTVKEQPLTIV